MKKIFIFLFLSLFSFSFSHAIDAQKITNEWLLDKSVNELTQNHNFKLSSITNYNSTFTAYHLINGSTIVTCLAAPGNTNLDLYCMLP